MTRPLVCLSVRQPWAYAILYLGKDVENRVRNTSHRGLTLIHASAALDEDYEDAVRFIDQVRSSLGIGGRVPPRSVLERGGIVGAVDLTGSVTHSPSRWFVGPKGYTMQNQRALPFTPCKGTIMPTFWPLPEGQAGGLRLALGLPPA